MEHKPIIAITMGDPSGIGPEICLKLLDNEDVHNICNVIIFGDVAVLNLAATKLNLNPTYWCYLTYRLARLRKNA